MMILIDSVCARQLASASRVFLWSGTAVPIDDHRDSVNDALLLLRCHVWKKVRSRACGQDCAASSEGFKVRTGLRCSTKRMSIIWQSRGSREALLPLHGPESWGEGGDEGR